VNHVRIGLLTISSLSILLLGTHAQAQATQATNPIVHILESQDQYGPNELHVLTPNHLVPDRKYPVLYVLPVYPGAKPAVTAIDEARKLDLANRYNVICVSPAFDRMPWYADHATDPHIRQESYFLNTVIPFVENHYPTMPEARGRLLVGYSKSGWGAFTLLLRHPDLFSKAAAFDAPLATKELAPFRLETILGTQENFEHYRVDKLIEQRADLLKQSGARLILLGDGRFAAEHQFIHEKLEMLGVPHHWEHGTPREHKWNSGWLEPAVQFLFSEEQSR